MCKSFNQTGWEGITTGLNLTKPTLKERLKKQALHHIQLFSRLGKSIGDLKKSCSLGTLAARLKKFEYLPIQNSGGHFCPPLFFLADRNLNLVSAAPRLFRR